MPKTFKVKYKERAALARALQREIRSKGLVDTGTLIEGVRIAAGSGANLNGITLRVVAPYYYLFQDRGADLWNGGRIQPQDITEDWLRRPKVKAVIETIVQQYLEWAAENYPFLEVARFADNPKIFVGFSFFGDPTGKWNIDIAPGR